MHLLSLIRTKPLSDSISKERNQTTLKELLTTLLQALMAYGLDLKTRCLSLVSFNVKIPMEDDYYVVFRSSIQIHDKLYY